MQELSYSENNMQKDALICEVIFTKGFGIIPKSFMKNPDIPWASKVLYGYYRSFTGAGNIAFPSNNKTCKDLGYENPRTIAKNRKPLESSGYIITKQQKSKESKFASNYYYLPDFVNEDKEVDFENNNNSQVNINILSLRGIYINGYGVISKIVMQDPFLSVKGKAVYLYIVSLTGGGYTSFPSHEEMKRNLNMSEVTIKKAVSELKLRNYITTKKETNEKGQFLRTIYTIVLNPNNDFIKSLGIESSEQKNPQDILSTSDDSSKRSIPRDKKSTSENNNNDSSYNKELLSNKPENNGQQNNKKYRSELEVFNTYPQYNLSTSDFKEPQDKILTSDKIDPWYIFPTTVNIHSDYKPQREKHTHKINNFKNNQKLKKISLSIKQKRKKLQEQNDRYISLHEIYKKSQIELYEIDDKIKNMLERAISDLYFSEKIIYNNQIYRQKQIREILYNLNYKCLDVAINKYMNAEKEKIKNQQNYFKVIVFDCAANYGIYNVSFDE